jgi:hypothetical protein
VREVSYDLRDDMYSVHYFPTAPLSTQLHRVAEWLEDAEDVIVESLAIVPFVAEDDGDVYYATVVYS